MSQIISVKDAPFNAVGNGTADDTAAIQAAIDFCFGPPAAPHGVNFFANQVLFFPPGHYRTTAPLKITKLQGGKVRGSGRFTTTIRNSTAGSNVIETNGCSYSHFEGMQISGAAGAVLFDLNFDGTPGGAALQSNTFHDMFFQAGAVGCRIGQLGKMGSENLFLNCFFSAQTEAGLKTENYNALQNTVIGGNFAGCKRGIYVRRGSVPLISGVGFQVNKEWDIAVDSSANDTMVLAGCRSESVNFWRGGGMVHLLAQGCAQTNGALGTFVDCQSCPTTIERCISVAGKIIVDKNGRTTIRGSSFGRDEDWLIVNPGLPLSHLRRPIEIEDVQYNGTPNGSKPTGAPPFDFWTTKSIDRRRITKDGIFNYTVAQVV